MKEDENLTDHALEPLPGSHKGVGGRPTGYPKTGGRKAGTPNKTPALAQAIANKHSPDAVSYLVGVMQGKRVSRDGKWVYPSPHVRTIAACKILDIAEMPAKRNLIGGTPVQVNIAIGPGSGPVTIEGGA